MIKVEHIGIAVKNLEQANKLFQKLFKTPHYKTEEVESEGVVTSFFQTGETKIELLGSEKPESAISKFIDKKGEGIHHIAFAVDDLKSEIIRLKKEGFVFVSEEPKKGADNKLICFIHPRSTNGILVELCQDIR